MQLQHDCIRALLLELEEKLLLHQHLMLREIKELDCTEKYGEDNVIYSIFRLHEANYLNVKHKFTSNELIFLSISSLTWDGHLFLDTIRDNKVWKETKNIVSGFSSVSLSLISSVGSSVIQEMIKNKLGI